MMPVARLPLFYRRPVRYLIPSERNIQARKILTEQQRLLYRGTPNKIFQTLLTMARRPANSYSHTLTAWNHNSKRPLQVPSGLPTMFTDIGIAFPIYKDRQRTQGYMLNADGLRVLELIALRDADHRVFVEAYYPKDGTATIEKMQNLSDLNRSRLNPTNEDYFTLFPF